MSHMQGGIEKLYGYAEDEDRFRALFWAFSRSSWDIMEGKARFYE